jgi:hypothetical protein
MTAMSSRSPRDALQLLDVVDGHAATRLVADLVGRRVEERRNLETLLAETGVVREREAEIARADNRDTQATVEPEDLAKVPPQFLDVVPDAANAELAEVREVFSNLRGVEMELLGEALRGDRLDTAGIELVETAEVDRQAVRRELGDLIGRLPPLVRPIHKVQCYHHAPWHIRT